MRRGGGWDEKGERKGVSRVTVIVLNWNGKDVLPGCLGALRRQTYRDFSVWMVDNGSLDGSDLWVRKHHPEVTVIAYEQNRGFCKAYNDVLPHVTTPYVSLMNNDVVATPDWLHALVTAMDEDSQLWAAASKMLFYDAPHRIDRAGDAYTLEGAALMRGRGESASKFNRKEKVFGVCAGAALYRTAVFRELGYFDEYFFILHEDVDVSFRARLRGYECVYVPEAVVFHKGSHSLGRESPTAVYYGQRNLEWVYLKNMPTPILCLSWPLHLLFVIAAGAYFLSMGHGRSFLAAKKDAFRSLRQIMRQRAAVQKQRTVSSMKIFRTLSIDLMRQRFQSKRRSLQIPQRSQ